MSGLVGALNAQTVVDAVGLGAIYGLMAIGIGLVFGVLRLPGGKWDCLLDREHKIGYVRVGPIEYGADERLAEMLADLAQQGCRGLILDLRWCPGGFVNEGTRIAGLFLPAGATIARMKYRIANEPGNRPDERAADGPKFADVPLVVLVGSETTGGGELIAAALQDSGRATVIGFFQAFTLGGTLARVIGLRKMVPSMIPRMVALGEGHWRLRSNSFTRSSLGVIVAHLTATPCSRVARAASTVTWSSVASRLVTERS